MLVYANCGNKKAPLIHDSVINLFIIYSLKIDNQILFYLFANNQSIRQNEKLIFMLAFI